jgi:probable phosphoglycerate mutase
VPTILLIRHGENDFVKEQRLAGRQPGVHLNEHGRAQAYGLANRLASMPLVAIYSSPLERAYETAGPIARVKNLPIGVRPALLETDCGLWQDQKLADLRNLPEWKSLQGCPSGFRFPGGESIIEMQERIRQDIDALLAGHSEKDVIACVSHADPIKVAVAYYIGLPLDHFQRLNVATASITTLQFGEAGCQLLTLSNDFSSNYPPLSTSLARGL